MGSNEIKRGAGFFLRESGELWKIPICGKDVLKCRLMEYHSGRFWTLLLKNFIQ
jgi:hypothetical protein